MLDQIHISFEFDKNENRIFLNQMDVTADIRKPEVSQNVSEYSTIPEVRRAMVKQQRMLGSEKGIIMDGRDIGSIVFPNAELKLFITADIRVRAQRRYRELMLRGEDISLEDVQSNLSKRDHIDSTRSDSPLIKATDAVLIDTTNLNIQEQIGIGLLLARFRIRAIDT